MDDTYEQEWQEGYTPATAMEEASRCLLCQDAPCSQDCPASTDPAKFIRSIRFLNEEGAVETIFENNALGDICARVCPTERYCQKGCSRTDIDHPIDIKGLQRYATDYAYDISMKVLEAGPDTGHSIAIVGSGPAALQAAASLRCFGHAVDIYERQPTPGGMLVHGIPAYRLPDDIVNRAISRVKELGATIHCDVSIGTGPNDDITIGQLLGKHDAVLLDPGLSEGKMLSIFKDNDNVKLAVDFLDEVRSSKGTMKVSDNVLVIGGGDVAMDVSTTLKKLGVPTVTDVIWERSCEFLASKEELDGAREMGVTLIDGYEPKEASGHQVTFKHRVIDSTLTISADLIILAVGQRPDLDHLGVDLDLKGVEMAQEGPATSDPHIFVTGDIAQGDKTVVWAVRRGKEAAGAIDASLKGGE
ncbi:MAG: FAD-dependent oxidoreductase [Coriobacteriaceae bacterium]